MIRPYASAAAASNGNTGMPSKNGETGVTERGQGGFAVKAALQLRQAQRRQQDTSFVQRQFVQYGFGAVAHVDGDIRIDQKGQDQSRFRSGTLMGTRRSGRLGLGISRRVSMVCFSVFRTG
jgi:hypothetical protein